MITVLSGSRPETMAFARQKQLGYGIKHIVNRDSLRGARPTEVHVLPSFYKRRDIHAINSELKRIRRQLPNTPFIDWELQATGIYVQTSAEYEPAEPAVNPKPVAKNPEVAIDTSKDAVPGQIGIDEVIVDDSNLCKTCAGKPIQPHCPECRTRAPAPADDFLDFLDAS